MTTNEIREMWIKFFKEKNHHIQENKSLVPINDDSLLFINSGVATLKPYLDGREKPISKRLANSQRSLRTNDIENVGKTSRHHTLFEMLGNFSIGDYFKDQAIDYAYEILTGDKWFGLDIDDLYFTVHPDDKVAFDKWLSLGIKAEKIVKLEENFWEIGKGPGGPNTEIFFDRGEKYDKRNPVELLKDDLENDRVIEIWNIVFSEFNCDPENLKRSEYKELPQKNIDTGMGLERMACIMQDVETNFETDNFQAIIKEVERLTSVNYDDNKYPFRVIADHIRALTFAINDGVIPSNEGRGYVLRRLIRRSITVAYLNLDIKTNFLENLVDIIVTVNAEVDANINKNVDKIKRVINQEEEKFFQTINNGMKLVFKVIEDEQKINGEMAFKLYDTYGFPIEITMEIAQNNNVEIDIEGFEVEMEKQKQRARNSQKNKTAIHMQSEVFSNLSMESKFIGYDVLSTNSKVLMLSDGEKKLDSQKPGEISYIILDKTSFYATMGGQSADSGVINGNTVIDVQKLSTGQHLHKVELKNEITVGDVVICKVDKKIRMDTAKNHSATHLLNYALKELFSKDIKQAGSFNDSTKLRFDFTYDKKLKNDDLINLNKYINKEILDKNPIIVQEMSIASAKELGAEMQFEDKYGDVVRVVQMGNSIELCGGTHASNTSAIKYFHIVNETSVGSGIRRIEAITGNDVLDYEENLISEIKTFIAEQNNRLVKNKKLQKEKLANYMEKLAIIQTVTDIYYEEVINELLSLERRAIEMKKESKKSSVDVTKVKAELISDMKISEINMIEREFTVDDNMDAQSLRVLSDQIMNEVDDLVLILSLNLNGKIMMIVKVSESITDKYDAGNILNEKLSVYGGSGKGSKTRAQGGVSIK